MPNSLLDPSHRDEAASGASERLALARRLHDGPAQHLIALGFELDALIAEVDIAPHIRSRIRELRLEVSSISASFRDEIYLLRQITFSKLPELIRLILPAAELDISLPISIFTGETEDKISSAILEIARNTARHSAADRFVISYKNNDRVEISIVTNSKVGITLKDRSFGLKIITEVISQAGGEINWMTNASGSEFRISLVKP